MTKSWRNPKLRTVFCAITFILFLLGVLGKFHFSSLGVLDSYLDGAGTVSEVIAGTPQVIRSDEWQLGVPWLLSQYNSEPRWPINNPSVGAESSALLVGLPTWHWSAIFRPAHWGFFLFDFERGFSWMWMFRTVVLFAALVMLCSQVAAGSLVLGLVGALWIYFSSFVQWWLASVAEMLLYFSLACISFSHVFQARDARHVSISTVSFFLFGVAFALCIYPPFQVPLVYLGISLLPFLLPQTRDGHGSWMPMRWLLVSLSVAIGVVCVGVFLAENRDAVRVMSETVYPGRRLSTGGGMSVERYFSGFFNLFFRYELVPARYGNICEASALIVLWPIAALCMQAVPSRRERWRCAPLLLFLVASTAWAFWGVPEWMATSTGWSLVPTVRAVIAWGLGGVFLCIATMSRQPQISKRYKIILTVLCALFVASYTVFYRDEIGLQVSPLRYIHAAIVVSLLAGALVWNSRGVALLALFVACVVPHALVNPLMRGVSVVENSRLVRAVQRFDTAKRGTWIVVGSSLAAQLVKTSGRRVLNGAQYIPNLSNWQALDPAGTSSKVYNRYAHIGVDFVDDVAQPLFTLTAPDAWQLTVNPCGGALATLAVTHVAWVDYDRRKRFSCLERVYVEKNIAVYKVRHSTNQEL